MNSQQEKDVKFREQFVYFGFHGPVIIFKINISFINSFLHSYYFSVKLYIRSLNS